MYLMPHSTEQVCKAIEAIYDVVESVVSIMSIVSYIFPQESVTLETVFYTYFAS